MRTCTASAYLINLHQNQEIVVFEVDCVWTANAICHLLDYNIPSQRGVIPYRRPNRELDHIKQISFPALETALFGCKLPTGKR